MIYLITPSVPPHNISCNYPIFHFIGCITDILFYRLINRYLITSHSYPSHIVGDKLQVGDEIPPNERSELSGGYHGGGL